MRTLSTSDNLSDPLVNCIYKDSKGYIWFGTEVGLDRFDGNQIMRFQLPEKSNVSRRINSIMEVGDDMYIGNREGLYILKHGAKEMQRVLPNRLILMFPQ